ncbi:MAG: FAD-dependent thymidylate synthase [Eubacteriales bacterium]
MSELKVALLAYTPEPQKTVACGAKMCYSASGVQEIREGLTPEKVDSFLQMLAELGHGSVFEHAYFTFGIEGVSRSLLAQLTRHRIASYSVKSQRYVREGQFQFVIPPEIDAIPQARERFLQAMEEDQRAYDELTEILRTKHLQRLLEEGIPEKRATSMAEKQAIEDARFVLPNACETKLVMTINARSLFNFFQERCCNRAQWEIRALAMEMLRLVREVAPTIFANAGPACLRGDCPEGKMTCGKVKEVRERFSHV